MHFIMELRLVLCYISSYVTRDYFDSCSVKSSDNDKDIQTLSDIEEGDLVRGYIKRCSDVGVFVR